VPVIAAAQRYPLRSKTLQLVFSMPPSREPASAPLENAIAEKPTLSNRLGRHFARIKARVPGVRFCDEVL
jgi:hypothetical protein